MAKLKS